MSDLDDATGTVLGDENLGRDELDAFPPPQVTTTSRRWRKPAIAVAVILGLAAIGGVGYLFGRASDGEVSTTPNLSSEELIPAASDDSEDQSDAATTDTDDDAGNSGAATDADNADADSTASSDTAADSNASADDTAADDATDGDGDGGGGGADGVTTDVDDDEGVVDNSDGSIRSAVFRDGQLFLRGRVPSEAVSTEIETKAGAIVGPDNVFNEYEIDPSVPAQLSSPLFVEDVVLFEFNSVEIRRPFLPILDLGTQLLTLNPNVEIVVVGRTDAEGSEALNLEVSEQRAQGVIDYWVRNGIDPQRLSIDARGESEASDLDDEETAALNRRAEFIISGLLDD